MSPDSAGRARLGERLRDRMEDLVHAYVGRLRKDPRTPIAATLPTPQLEDHAISFLADVFQSLVVLERAAETNSDAGVSDLLRDGSTIQQLVADLHGRQRQRLGWTEDGLQREYDVLHEEVEALARRRSVDGDLSFALDVLHRLLDRAREASVVGFRAEAQSHGAAGA